MSLLPYVPFRLLGFLRPLRQLNTKPSLKEHEITKMNNPFSWIGKHAVGFRVNGSKVKVFTEPSEFCEALKVHALRARRRITLASLYLGTGPLEQELVQCITQSVTEGDENMKVQVLIDFTRGSRGTKNSRSMLLPLLQNSASQVNISLYHTPSLRGYLKSLIPDRYNEIIGLSHIKAYVFDNNLIISGANLSNDYFTNRQDRYMLFEDCPELADYFYDLVQTVASVSLQLQPDDTLKLHESCNVHPYDGDYYAFITEARKKILSTLFSEKWNWPLITREDLDNKINYIGSPSSPDAPSIVEENISDYERALINSQQSGDNEAELDTWVYPIVQMSPFDIKQDSEVVKKFLKILPSQSVVKLSSGYFNLTDSYINVIVNESKADFSILTSSPRANGFFGSRGIAGGIPAAYCHIIHNFMNYYYNHNQHHRLRVLEYERPSWTFHAKGLWYYPPREDTPQVTLIGSPNFGYRSEYKDLEAQVCVVTYNAQLRQQLQEEQKNLYSLSQQVTWETFTEPDHRVPLWVQCVARFMKNFF